jgi:hypothetical protein
MNYVPPGYIYPLNPPQGSSPTPTSSPPPTSTPPAPDSTSTSATILRSRSMARSRSGLPCRRLRESSIPHLVPSAWSIASAGSECRKVASQPPKHCHSDAASRVVILAQPQASSFWRSQNLRICLCFYLFSFR